IKNKLPPPNNNNNDRSDNTPTNTHSTTNTLPTKTTTIPSTTSTSTTKTPKPTTTEPNFDLLKRPKNLLEKESTSSFTSPSSLSSTKSTFNTLTKTDDFPSKTTLSELPKPISDNNNVSCPICKLEFTQTEIEKHLQEYIRNLLSKDFIHDKLKIKKSAIEFDNIFYKLTDFQIRELIETIEKYIEKYGDQFIDFIPDNIKQEILYNFDKIMLGVIGLIIKLSNLSFFFINFIFNFLYKYILIFKKLNIKMSTVNELEAKLLELKNLLELQTNILEIDNSTLSNANKNLRQKYFTLNHNYLNLIKYNTKNDKLFI
ncbi:6840_t:CDS:1, partial [Gigaspora margarita]